MSPDMTDEEAVELMEENFVGQRVEVPKTLSDKTITYDITAARVRNGQPELQRIPIDHNGGRVRMNKEWISLHEYNDKALAEEGEWTVIRA